MLLNQGYVPCNKQIHIKIPENELQMIHDRMEQGSVKWPMKEWAKKKKAQTNLENVDIDTEKLSEGLGRRPKNLQGTSPLTQSAGSARTRPRRKQASKPTCWPDV